MSISRIPLEKRFEALADATPIEVTRTKPILRRLAALRLDDLLEGESIETVLMPVRHLGVTANSTLAEAAAAIKWASSRKENELGADYATRLVPPFASLHAAVFELAVRFECDPGSPEPEIDRLRTRLEMSKAKKATMHKIPLAQRIEAVQGNPKLVIDQVGKITLRHYLDAFLALTGNDPDLVESIEFIEDRVPENLKYAIVDVARHVKKNGPFKTNTDLLRAYFVNPLASMCEEHLDFSKRLEPPREPEMADERRGWKKIDEQLKGQGY